MTRKKVHLTYNAGDSARKATYTKREKWLLTKVSELTTLCGMEACAIICNPYGPELVVWQDHEEDQKVVENFRDLPEMVLHQKMFDHPAFLWQQINKSSKQLECLLRDNREKSMSLAMFGCLAGKMGPKDLTGMDLSYLVWMIDRNLAKIGRQLEEPGQGSATLMPPTPQQPMPNLGLSTMLAPLAQLSAEGAGAFGMGHGGITGMPMQGPVIGLFHGATEAGGRGGV